MLCQETLRGLGAEQVVAWMVASSFARVSSCDASWYHCCVTGARASCLCLAGEASAARRRRQESLAARVEEALQYCEELDSAGSVLARRALLDAGAPRRRAGALDAGSMHRRWYLHATGAAWDGSWNGWERALRSLRSDPALRDGARRARPRGRPRRVQPASPEAGAHRRVAGAIRRDRRGTAAEQRAMLPRVMAAMADLNVAAGSRVARDLLGSERVRAPRYRAGAAVGSVQRQWYLLVCGTEWDGSRRSWDAALRRMWDHQRPGRLPAGQMRRAVRRQDARRSPHPSVSDGESWDADEVSLASASAVSDGEPWDADEVSLPAASDDGEDFLVGDVVGVSDDADAADAGDERERLLAGNSIHLRPVAYGVRFWGSYTHSGTCIAPHGVRASHTVSWFLCVLLADAAGLSFLYPPRVVPRPAADSDTWRAIPLLRLLPWQRLVALVRCVLEARGLTRAQLIAGMDGQAHWPAEIQESIVHGVEALSPPDVSAEEHAAFTGAQGVLAASLAEVCRELATRMEGRSLYQTETFLPHVSNVVAADLLAEANDDCLICMQPLSEPAVQFSCCRLLLHRACAIGYFGRASDAPRCIQCRGCLGCVASAAVPCSVHGTPDSNNERETAAPDIVVPEDPSTNEQIEAMLAEHTDLLSSAAAEALGGTCAVCLTDLGAAVAIRMQCCEQGMHRSCMMRWLLEGHSTCCLCRAELGSAAAGEGDDAVVEGDDGDEGDAHALDSANDDELLRLSAERLAEGQPFCVKRTLSRLARSSDTPHCNLHRPGLGQRARAVAADASATGSSWKWAEAMGCHTASYVCAYGRVLPLVPRDAPALGSEWRRVNCACAVQVCSEITFRLEHVPAAMLASTSTSLIAPTFNNAHALANRSGAPPSLRAALITPPAPQARTTCTINCV